MAQVQSAGFLVFRHHPTTSFLLMQHANRWDLPKGHLDDGETLEQCALRELEEETGLGVSDVEVDPDFRFQHEYNVMTKEFSHPVRKRLTIYLATQLPVEFAIQPTEHLGYQWIEWSPPHKIQKQTIDPLLEAAAKHFATHPERLSRDASPS